MAILIFITAKEKGGPKIVNAFLGDDFRETFRNLRIYTLCNTNEETYFNRFSTLVNRFFVFISILAKRIKHLL